MIGLGRSTQRRQRRLTMAINKFELYINMGNDGMQSLDDIAEALKSVQSQLRQGKEAGKIYDSNGNSIGSYVVKEINRDV
jgi:hypothetical protein